LDSGEIGGLGADNVAGIVDPVSSDGETDMTGVDLLGAEGGDNA
jgi:hypothetical protein